MRRRQTGMTFIEVLVAMAILSIIIFSVMTVTGTALKGSRNNMDKQFATQKAISILEELKALVQSSDDGGTVSIVLESFDDGVSYKDMLTTDQSPAVVGHPEAPVSGNTLQADGTWLYTRRIQVRPLPGVNSNDVRIVSVAVFKNEGAATPRLLAEVTGVLRTLAQNMPPTQVYDVYAIAIENVPGWWVYMNNLIPFVQSEINNLQGRNPGLVFRTHWITKLAYGRDQRYRPFVNMANPSTNVINDVYFYPGTMPGGSATSAYYPPLGFRAQVSIDGTLTNGLSVASNPFPYALADQFNHAMRYEDERALYQQRRAAQIPDPDPDPTDPPGTTVDAYPNEEMTLRLLLEDMHLNPDDYTNAILINLHGELMPFPPIRNYSDAAKLPDTIIGGQNLANVRVVTHPERLWYETSVAPPLNPPMTLRVYSYRTDNASGGNFDFLGQGAGTDIPITIRIPNVEWTAPVGAGEIRRIYGGVPGMYASVAAPADLDYVNDPNTPVGWAAGEMRYDRFIDTDAFGIKSTIIKLYNSPLRTPESANNDSGLATSARLYGLEYIPAPMEDLTAGGAAFTVNLSNTTNNASKNTARWVITIPANVLPNSTVPIVIETRINDDLTTGTMANQPENLSRTFVYRGTNLWAFGNRAAVPPVNPNLPITERFQMIGDPRHCPYMDLKLAHDASGLAVGRRGPLGQGYNRYFDDFDSDALDLNTDGDTNDFNEPGGNRRAQWPGWYYQDVAAAWFGVKNATAAGPAALLYKNDDGWDTRGDKTDDPGVMPAPNYRSGFIEVDVPRVFQIVRTSLLRSNAVWTTMTGFSYYYLGIGNEIGYDSANGFADSIPVHSRPFSGTNVANWYEQAIINGDPAPCTGSGCRAGVKYIYEQNTGWWGMNWLGELYPDSAFATWKARGNLDTGVAANQFRRVIRESLATTVVPGQVPTRGTRMIAATRRTRAEGSTTFFSAGAAYNASFHHLPDEDIGSLQTAGREINTAFNFPEVDPIPNNRPFLISTDDGSEAANGFIEPQYGGPITLTRLQRFYRHVNTDDGSALVASRETATTDTTFVVVNGLSPTGASGTSFIARWSFLSLIQSYLLAGLYTDGVLHPIGPHQVPQLVITAPNVRTNLVNATSIDVNWTRNWLRWNGVKYTSGYAAGFAEADPLWFFVLYSRDNGMTWTYAKDESPATLGNRNGPASARFTSGTVTYNWPTPAGLFPQGNYLIRVETYRQGSLPLHYAFHQVRVFIRRTS